MNKENIKYIIVASHRRSGTHWIIDSIFNNFKDVSHGYLNIDRLLPFSKDHISIDSFRKKLSGTGIKILKTHASGDLAAFKQSPSVHNFFLKEIMPLSKVIHIRRDERDILNSLFYYLRFKGNIYRSFSEFLRSNNNFDNICPDLNRVEFLKYHLNSWEKVENILSIDFSDLIEDYLNVVRRMSDFIGLESIYPVKVVELKKYPKLLRGIRRIFPFLFKTTAILPREGKTGGWEENFSVDDVNFYESIMNKQGT